MSGTETISYAYLGIAFNDFFVHPEFAESYSLGEKESLMLMILLKKQPE